MTNSRVLIYTRDKNPIAEIVCRTSRTWVLNRANDQLGEAHLFISVNDPNLSENLIKYGNLLLISDQYLPYWGGVIDCPQNESYDEIEVHATSAEILLDDRTMYAFNHVDSDFGVFRNYIRYANSKVATGIDEGDIEDDDSKVAKQRGMSALQIIQTLQERNHKDWGVSADLDGQGLPDLRAWWKTKIGTDYSADVALVEGDNIELASQPIISLQGRV